MPTIIPFFSFFDTIVHPTSYDISFSYSKNSKKSILFLNACFSVAKSGIFTNKVYFARVL